MKIIKDATSKDRFTFPLAVTCVGCGSTLEAASSDVNFKASEERFREHNLQQPLAQMTESRTPAYFYVACPICDKKTAVGPNKLG